MDLCSMRWVQTLWPKHLPLLAEFGVSYEYTLHSGWSCPERWFAWGRKSGIVRGKWWYELWDMNYMNKGRFFLRNYKPTNQRIRFSQAKKHETTSTWINRKNKQKKHELNDGAVFHFQTVRFQWEVQRLLELKMDPNETCEPHGTSAVHQVGGGCFTGGSVMIPLMSVFYVGKKWSDLAWQANQAAIGGHCEVLQLLQNFGAVLWQKTGVADGLGAYEVVANGGWRAVWR